MKKITVTATLLTIMIMIGSATPMLEASHAADPVTVIVDGRRVRFPDAPAFVDRNGRTQIPVRHVGEAMGMRVQWDQTAARATFSMDINSLPRHVDFYIGSDVYYVKDAPDNIPRSKTMNTTAFVGNNRTYVPVRYLAESFGATVRWDSKTKTVHITSHAAAAAAKEARQPLDTSAYSNDGLLLAQYANVFYDQWLESLSITYADDKVFLSYSIPEGIPENAELRVALSGKVTEWSKYDENGKYIGGPEWSYRSYEIRAGDREAGREEGTDFLIPNPASGGVTKELVYIPFEDLWLITLSAFLATPPGGGPSWTVERYAQSAMTIYINLLAPEQNEISNSAYDIRTHKIGESSRILGIDVFDIVIFE